MKTSKIYILLFFVFLLFFYGKDLVFSYFLSKDEYLSMPIILENDYNVLKKDYDELLEATQMWQDTPQNFITSKVVSRDPYIFFEEMTILKGKEENISVDDIIINDKGYIGRIKSVFKHHSQVELLTNQLTKLQVRVNESYGILRKEGEVLKIFDMTSKENIESGTIVYTSSLAGIPGDIPVGIVNSVKPHPLGQEIELKPCVDFENIKYVSIRKKGASNEP